MKLKLIYFSTFIICLLITPLSLKVAAQESGDKAAIEGRAELMGGIRDIFQPFRSMLKAGAFDFLAVKSDELHGLAQMITKDFSKKALSSKSRAKEEIGSDWEGFSQKAKEFSDAVVELQAASKASDTKKAQASVKRALTACKNCHRAFRKPKPKAEDEYQ